MKIIDSPFSNQILKSVENEIGSIFFIKKIAVLEINEGIHFDNKNAALIFDEIVSYFKNNQPFGLIANRVNSYSIDLIEASSFKERAENLFAYAVVSHDPASKMNAKLENDFCELDNIDYDNLPEAISSVCIKIKTRSSVSLN